MFGTPTDAERYVQQGFAALRAGQAERAETAFLAALASEPDNLMALTRLAEIDLLRGDPLPAIRRLDRVLAIEPNFAPARDEMARACWMAGRRSAALEAARLALSIQPANPRHRLQLAQFAAWMGRGRESEATLAPLLDPMRCAPDIHATAVGMLGELAVAEGRFDEANPHLLTALRLDPTLPAPRLVLGMNQLRLGEFRRGWPNYLVREQVSPLHPNGAPAGYGDAWQGQDLAGKTILVQDDQGFGDSIQFFRYMPLLTQLGARHVTLKTFPPLVRLLRSAVADATVLAELPSSAQFDYHCTSSSLPRWLGTTPATIPAAVPYLRPLKPSRRPKRGPLQIGLLWSGDPRHNRDHLRSVPAELFLRLANVAGPRFHSLQKDPRPEDRAALEARPGIDRGIESAADFADSAALLARLDLVITVDTAIAHLAGAMGIPVWIVLHIAPDWRWLAGRADSPWYPTARLFRLPAVAGSAGDDEAARRYLDWTPVLREVDAALRRLPARL
jgi:tetratricopeptide (TPR) repeat protein